MFQKWSKFSPGDILPGLPICLSFFKGRMIFSSSLITAPNTVLGKQQFINFGGGGGGGAQVNSVLTYKYLYKKATISLFSWEQWEQK